MEINRERIDELVRNPSEGLNVEIKRWIDPTQPEGQAKIVKGCLALRNRNGGSFVIGFDDETLQPDLSNTPEKPREVYHVDRIQALVSRYAQDIFEIGVVFSERDGIDYPVIVVPAGVQVPVAVKQSLTKDGKTLVGVRDVYFRTLHANNIPSTSLAQPKDWRDIFEICFQNREADIGAFFRRHLSSSDRQALAETLLRMGLSTVPAIPQRTSLKDRAKVLLETGRGSFQKALQERGLSAEQLSMSEALSWEIALTTEPELPAGTPDKELMRAILGSNPRYTGWPVWLDSQAFQDRADRPYRSDKSWEALVVGDTAMPHLDFWRLQSNDFYLRRALQDDLTPKVSPGTALDPVLVIIRVAEAIAVGLAIVRTLRGDDTTERTLGFAFRWKGLAQRRLQTWSNLSGMIGAPTTRLNEVTTFVELGSDTPPSAIAPFVDGATRELFASFEGERIPRNSIELWTQRLLDRQL